MERTWNWKERAKARKAKSAAAARSEIQRAVASARSRLLSEYWEVAGEQGRLLRLTLNEAEALAYATGFPHLFFPALAAEKVEQSVSWHKRQREIRRVGAEVSFAE
jgi:hypothetical protein